MTACEQLRCGHLVPDARARYGVVLICPQCRTRGYRPDDMHHGWCGRCRDFVTEPHPAFEPERS